MARTICFLKVGHSGESDVTSHTRPLIHRTGQGHTKGSAGAHQIPPKLPVGLRRVKRLQTCSTESGPSAPTGYAVCCHLTNMPTLWPSLSKCASACRYMHECSACKSQRRASDFLKLEEVQATVTCPVWVPGTRRGSSGVQVMPSTTEPSFQPQGPLFLFFSF